VLASVTAAFIDIARDGWHPRRPPCRDDGLDEPDHQQDVRFRLRAGRPGRGRLELGRVLRSRSHAKRLAGPC